jgi:hypothetical protein
MLTVPTIRACVATMLPQQPSCNRAIMSLPEQRYLGLAQLIKYDLGILHSEYLHRRNDRVTTPSVSSASSTSSTMIVTLTQSTSLVSSRVISLSRESLVCCSSFFAWSLDSWPYGDCKGYDIHILVICIILNGHKTAQVLLLRRPYQRSPQTNLLPLVTLPPQLQQAHPSQRLPVQQIHLP